MNSLKILFCFSPVFFTLKQRDNKYAARISCDADAPQHIAGLNGSIGSGFEPAGTYFVPRFISVYG